MIAIVLGAHDFVEWHFRRAPVAPVALDRAPRHREGAWVLNAHVDLQPLAVLYEPEALDPVKLCRMRGAIVVDVRPVVHADGVDHQGIAVFVMADRLAIP